MGNQYTNVKPEDRFLALINKKPSGCWLWNGFLKANVTPQFTFDGEAVGARWAGLVLFKGHPKWDRRKVLSDCGKSLCVNPDHCKVAKAAGG